MARALGVNIVSTFDSKGIRKAITDFKKLGAAGASAGTKATFALRTMDKAVTNGAKNVAKFGLMAGAAFGAVSFGLVKVAEAAATSNARIEQINKSMGLFGGAAQQVTDRLIKLSETQAMATGIDRNAIKETVAKLLTFKELAATADTVGGAFDRATQSAIDLSAAGFGSATENATQLGKALNDPIKGITALNRSGVTFTAQEKEKIKVLVESGKMLEAQDTLLKAIESQVGGTATATANASDKMRQGLGMAAESLGILLLPAFQRLVAFINNTVVPNVEKFADLVGEEGLGAGLRMLGGGFLSLTTNMGKFGNIMLVLISLFVAMRGVAIAAAIAQNLFHKALLNTPIGRVVALFIVLGTAVVAAYLKFEGFRKVVNAVINFVIGGVENMVNKWIKALNIFIKALNFFRPLLGKLGINFEEIGEIGAVSFRRIGNAANKASDKIFKTIDAIQAAKNAERRGGGLPTVSGSNDDIIGGGAGSGGGQSPIEKAKQALEKYIDAVKGLTSAQKSLRDANKSVNQSNETLLEKTKALTEAQRKFNLVTKGYGADSKEAKNADKERTKAERAAERAKYALEQAVFAVSDAEKELAEIRKDPQATPKMIREAEIRLAESKLRVADATDEQVESSDALVASQNRLNEAVNGAKEGSDAYNEALKELADAEKDQRSAIDARTEAYERQAEAVEKLADAERDRVAAGKGVPKSDRAAVDASVPSVVAGVVAPVVDAIGRAIDVIPAPVAGGGFTQKDLDDLAAIGRGDFSEVIFGKDFDHEKLRKEIESDLGNIGIGVPFFANGGIVTKAMLGMVGESGAEAIIPLDRLGSMGSTYNIQVTAGMGADGKDIGTQIVNALKRYERTNGALPLTVQ
jgi:hypothetical protein